MFASDATDGQVQLNRNAWWEALRAELVHLGAFSVGVADVGEVCESNEWHEITIRVREWVRRGEHGTMGWLADAEGLSVRCDPRVRYPWIRTAIAAAFPYDTLPGRQDAVSLGQGVVPREVGRAKISRYAHGVDYHWHLGRALDRARRKLEAAFGSSGLQLRSYLDTGPVLERQWAERAGLGWLGKNSLLLHPQAGSFVFLSVWFASHSAPDHARLPRIPDRCGSCTRCIDACPTGALAHDGSGKLDARRCLSYLTIEARKDLEPDLLTDHHDGWWLGCDVCQNVCPWNRRAPLSSDPAFAPLPDYENLTPEAFAQLSAEVFHSRFRHTPLWRPRLPKLQATLGLLLRKG